VAELVLQMLRRPAVLSRIQLIRFLAFPIPRHWECKPNATRKLLKLWQLMEMSIGQVGIGQVVQSWEAVENQVRKAWLLFEDR